MSEKTIAFLCLLMLAFGMLFFFQAGNPSLFEGGEAKVAEVAREIIAGGKWIDLQLNFRPWFQTPPLYPWLTAITYKIFGTGETQARLWAALFSLGTLLAVFFISRQLYDEKTAGLSSMILGSSLLVVAFSRFGFVDSGLMFFITLSLLFFLIAYKDEAHKNLLMLSAFAMALGTLVKGPLGIILPGIILLLYIIVERDFGFLKRYKKEILYSILTYMLVAAPWWVAETIIHRKIFLYGLLSRYMAGSEPLYFYLLVVILGMIPWTAHMVFGVFNAFKKEEREQSNILLLWMGIVLAIFFIVQTKIPECILLVFPPLAIVAARGLMKLFFEDFKFKKLFLGLTFGLNTLLVFLLLIATHIIKADPLVMQFVLMLSIICFVLFCLTAASFAISSIKRISPLSIVPLLLIAIVFVFSASGYMLPAFEEYKPVKRLVGQAKEFVDEKEEIKFYIYRTRFRSSLLFYAKAKVIILDTDSKLNDLIRNGENYVIFTDVDVYNRIKPKLPQKISRIGLEFDLVAITDLSK